ncbi:MAG: relaxase/mobilization nuclease domain-containing protein [Bacillota bacterium]|nr:relaxase/mobilization nuclease domain-containing protein [Bacillota bacterium]
MLIIKLVNEQNKCRYAFPKDVENLLKYISKPEATRYPQGTGQYLIGMAPDIISADQPGAWERADKLFYNQIMLFPKHPSSLVMHRVISFEAEEGQDPVMAFMLAKEVAAFYFNRGYISFFGVHTDTDNVHIHIAVSAINWWNGRKFFIYDELGLLKKAINCWYQNYISGNPTPLF